MRIVWRREMPRVELARLETETSASPARHKGSQAPRFDGCFLAAAFDYSDGNRLGGEAIARRGAEARLGGDDRDRYLRVLPAETGRAAATVTLFDAGVENDTLYYLDGRQLDRFVLTVRADNPLTAQLRDASGRTVEVSERPVDDPRAWRQFEIPVPSDGLHEHHLAELRLAGGGSFDINRIDLCRGTAAPELAQRGTTDGRAMWFWHTSDLLGAGSAATEELIELAEATGVTRIHMQIPSGLDEAETRRAVAEVIGDLGAAGIETFALDGAPDYNSAGGRRTLGRALDRVMAHNAAVAPAGRFRGVHLDVEPYLADSWGTNRPEAIAGYLAMLEESAARIDGLAFDVAVPFWFDGIQVREETHEGWQVRSLTAAVLEYASDVTVMDYRTTSAGSNGILALASTELVAAAAAGKRLWIGLETTWLPDETLIRFRADALPGLPTPGERDWWVVQIGGELLAVPDELLGTLDDSSQRGGVVRHWPAYTLDIPASRQTFYDLGYDALDSALQSTDEGLAGHPAFAGFALHYERPLRRLLEAAR